MDETARVYLLIQELYGHTEFEVLAAYSTKDRAAEALASIPEAVLEYCRIDDVVLDPATVPDA